MQLAHLILAHTDLDHVCRLTKRLLGFSDVYIHIDANTDASELIKALSNYDSCYFIGNRLHCDWGGWNAVKAEIELIRCAMQTKAYDRLVFLQGADYPIKTDVDIKSFFEENQEIEYIRGCQISGIDDPYYWQKCRYISFLNNPNIVKRALNFVSRKLKLKVRSGYIREGKNKYPVYWGGALWSITGKCASYLLSFYDNHPKFNRWFWYAFAADELYFVTVIMNSPLKKNTYAGGPEKPMKGTINWRTLHIWEYLPGRAKVYTLSDFDFLKQCKELYVRKVNSVDSKELLDRLDKINNTSIVMQDLM